MSEVRTIEKATGLRRFLPYPAYKNSGVEWLGKIPEHWHAKRLKYVAPVTDERSDRVTSDLPYIGLEHIESSTGQLAQTSNGVSPEGGETDSTVSIFRRGDVLFGKLRPYLAKVFRPEFEGCCSTELLVLRTAGEILPSILAYQLLSSGFIGWVNAMTYGTKMPRANPDQVMNVPVALCPVPEQSAIAAFLDRETRKIDALVLKKERLIDLLQEKRAGLITRAVTKGLDQNVAMKESGVEWMGSVPAHWSIERNRWLFREADVRSVTGGEELLTVSHITGVTRRSEKPDVTMIEAESHEGYKVCRAYQLAINTMWAWMGALGIAWEDGMVSPSYNVYKVADTRLRPRYYDYFCRIPLHVAEIIRHSKGIWRSRLRLYPEAFFEIWTPLPPEPEQDAIISFLDRETLKIDRLISKVRNGIEQLKEHRTALISAAVTGKIDVRKEAA